MPCCEVRRVSPHHGLKRGSQTALEDGGLPKAQEVGEEAWTDARGGHSDVGGVQHRAPNEGRAGPKILGFMV